MTDQRETLGDFELGAGRRRGNRLREAGQNRAGERLAGRTHIDDVSKLDGLQSNDTGRDVGRNVGDAVRVRANEKYRDIGFCKILLMRKPFVEGDQNLKPTLRKAEKFSVGLARKTCFLDCGTSVLRRGEAALEASGNALIEQKVHSNWAMTRALASSSAEIAASRVTVGKSSRNSSRVSPPSR